MLEPHVKVKAHLSREQPEAIGQLALRRGNAAADAAAKARAERALPPSG